LLPIAWRALVAWRRIALRWPYLFALGLFGVGSFNSLQYVALVSSTPLNVTLVGASMPVWMLLVGSLFFGERPRTAQMVGAALSLAGVMMVLGRGSWAVLRGVQLVPGDLYVLAAVVGWAFYSWLLARPPAHMRGTERPRPDEGWDWAGLLLIQTLFGLLAAGTFTAGEQVLGAAPIHWSLGVGVALLYTALGASVAAYRCWGLGVAEGGPALASIFVNLTPLFAALLSALLLGEWPQPYHAAAFALIVSGIAASVALDRRQKVPG
jgi:drug/metabolite transporter (DMT)-like permease